MDHFSHCTQTISIRSEGWYTTYESSPKINIHFSFSCKPLFYDWILYQDSMSPEYSRTLGLDMIDNFVPFTFQHFLRDKDSREKIKDSIKNWPINDGKLGVFIDHVLEKALRAVKTKPVDHNVIYCAFEVLAIHIHVFNERRELDSVLEESMEDDDIGMVPALVSSIKLLKKIEVKDGMCMICLEELCVDKVYSKGALMPCSHVFHDDCIKKWLSTSHYCPICRYKMPTDLDMESWCF